MVHKEVPEDDGADLGPGGGGVEDEYVEEADGVIDRPVGGGVDEGEEGCFGEAEDAAEAETKDSIACAARRRVLVVVWSVLPEEGRDGENNFVDFGLFKITRGKLTWLMAGRPV